ncbi:MAG: hypothetical protein HQM09_16845 [Candidatus Riflebacteria bacterium]|nr:hypothetical protein [Candidatus Riflebacteria bacterium]
MKTDSTAASSPEIQSGSEPGKESVEVAPSLDSLIPDIFSSESANDRFPNDDDECIEMFRSIEDAIVLGHHDSASELLEQFKTAFGSGPAFLYLFGRLLRQKGESQRSYEVFKKLYFEWPIFMMDRRDFEEVRDFLMSDLLERGRAQWNKVLAIAARHASQEASNASKGETPPAADIDDSMKSEMEKLLTLYEHILTIESRQPIALKGLVHCLGELGHSEKLGEAQERLKDAMGYWNDLTGKRAQAVLVKARDMVKEGGEEAVISILNIGLDSAPMHTGLLFFKSEVLRRMGKFKEALSCLDVLLRDNPTDGDGNRLKKKIQSERVGELIGKGLAFLQEAEDRPSGSSQLKEKVKEALDSFYGALDYDPNNLKALGGIYRGQMMTNNTLKAKKTLERIKDIDPRFQLSQLTTLLAKDKQKDEISTCFIATRLYGRDHPETQMLRDFRQYKLRPTCMGRVFIRLYAHIGPRLAKLSGQGPAFTMVRSAVDLIVPIIRRLYLIPSPDQHERQGGDEARGFRL